MDFQHTNDSGMHFNRITLAFAGRHDGMEPIFYEHYFHVTLRQIRIAIIAAAVFYGFFGLMDVVMVPDRYVVFWTIRWVIVCPCILLILLFSFSRHAYQFMQPVFCLGTLIAGLGIIAMTVMAKAGQNYSYVGGLVQIIFFIFTFSRLRFIWATGISWCLIIAYLVAAMAVGGASNDIIIGHTFHLSCISLMGMMASYAIEYHTRRNFFLSRQLESKKRRLAAAKQFLEERVARRTSELRRTNELLNDEINERKAVEIALRDSEKRYRRMVDNVSDYMCVHDMDGNIMEANRPMRTGLDYSHTKLTTMNILDLMIPEQRSDFSRYLAKLRRTGKDVGEMTLQTHKGDLRIFEYSNVLAKHSSGRQAIYCLARDVTQRRKAEQALAESQACFKSIFETAAAGMMIVHAHDQRVVEVNRAAASMMAGTSDQIKGKRLDELIRSAGDGGESPLCKPTDHPMECVLANSQDKPLPILTSFRSTELNGQPCWIVSFINILKIKEAEAAKSDLEKRLHHSQHLEAIGTLAGGIAHDFNNILFGMMGFTELALDDAPQGSQQAGNLNEILRGGQRAKEMIAQILAFSRQESVERQHIQPTPLIKEALKLLRASLPTTIEIRTRFAPEVKCIDADPTQIHQVVMNLCTNAAHAMDLQGGLMEISLENIHYTSPVETPNGTLPAGDYVRLMVSDTGEGISPDVMDRIFEPFFTTKEQGQGSGMGLSMVLGIIQAHNGDILVASEPGKGTRFDILLPAVSATPKTVEPDISKLPTGMERILFVDDERSLAVMASRMLTSLGYHVATCEHPTEALDMFRNDPQAFDLIISDLTMPRMPGTRLAQELLKIRPGIPVILCTGYGEEITRSQIHALGIRELLPKPILKHNLAAAIRSALDID